MEDDWGSPWADADDRDRITSTAAPIIAAIGEIRGGGGARGGNGGRVPLDLCANAAAHAHDGPWAADNGRGFGAAWTPDARQGGWGGFTDGLAEDLLRPVEPGDGDLWLEDGNERETSLHPISTEEVNAWAGPDWGDQKTSNGEAGLRLDGLSVGLAVGSPEGLLGEANLTPDPDTGEKAQIGGIERNERNGESVTGPAASLGLSERGEVVGEEAEEDWGESPTQKTVQDMPQAGLGALPVFMEATEDTSSVHMTEKERDTRAANDRDTSDDDDDFGDFAEEGEFEEREEGGQTSLRKFVASTSLETAPPPVPISFDTDISLVSKLYPIPTSYPEPPPIEEIISTIESRRVWYRLSSSETVRRSRTGDGDYVRVTWAGSKIQEDVNKIVGRWMAEDRNSGGVGLMIGGGSRRLGAMFGWREADTKPTHQGRLSLEKPVSQQHLQGHQLVGASGMHFRKGSGVGFGGLSLTGLPPKLPSVGEPVPSHPSAAGEFVSSPQAASFGWGAMEHEKPITQPRSSPSSVKEEENTTPLTPPTSSFRCSVEPSPPPHVTPTEKSILHSPSCDSKSAGRLRGVSSDPSSPAPSSGALKNTTTTTPRPEPEPVVGDPVIEAPLSSALSTQVQTVGIATAPGYEDWDTLEGVTASISANSQPRNFGKWDVLEGVSMATTTTHPAQEPPLMIGGQSSPAATGPTYASKTKITPIQSSPEIIPRSAGTSTNNLSGLVSSSVKPSALRIPPDAFPSHVPRDLDPSPAAKPYSQDQRISYNRPTVGSAAGLRLSTPPAISALDGSGFSSISTGGGTATTASYRNPAITTIRIEESDDDDWGEMVQSPTKASGFSGAAVAGSSPHDVTIPRGSKPTLISPPRHSPRRARPALGAALSPSSSGQRRPASGVGGEWDLSCFEAPSPTPDGDTPLPRKTAEPASLDLWDAPPVARGEPPESLDDKAIRKIIEGLPNLGYMLG